MRAIWSACIPPATISSNETSDRDRSGDERDLGAIEAWFVARGVPTFVERVPSAWDTWGRALPLLVVAYVVLGLNALDLREWSWAANLGVAGFVIAVLVLTWIGANLLRGRPALTRPKVVGPVELALLVIAPAIPSALLAQWGDIVQTVIEGVLILLTIWVLTSYGAVPLARWAGRRAAAQAPAFVNLIVRALPLLLLFMTFLFVNAEVWEVAGTLEGWAYVVVLGLFFVLGSVFVLSRLPSVVRVQNSFGSWAEVVEVVPIPAVAGLLDDVADGPTVPHPARLPVRQRVNLALLAVFSQAMQITATALAMFAFFVLFGVLAIGADTVAGWTGQPVDVIAELSVGGRQLVLSEALLRVAGFLAAFAGMYFTVVLSTDATYREEFSEDIGPELRRLLATRLLYRRALGAP